MMRKVTPRFTAFLTIDLLLLVFGLYHLSKVFDRPRAPFEAVEANEGTGFYFNFGHLF